jgi:anaerobic selenocysteine-containing dehydrogenase
MPLHNYSKWARENWEKEGLPAPRAEETIRREYPLFHDTVGQPNVGTLYKCMSEGKPFPIKAWMVDTGNPVITLADTNYQRQGIDQLDFMTVHDVFMTETLTRDLVLPAATFYEQQSMYAYVGRPQVALLNKAMEPPEDCWGSGKVWIELAKRLGFEKHFPWKDVEEFHEKFFCPMIGTTIDTLKSQPGGWLYRTRAFKKYETEGISTPSGKVELYCQKLADHGFDPLPTFHEPALSAAARPDLQRQYPLIVVTGTRILEFSQSMLLGVPTLRGKIGQPKAEINTETARKLGIESGDPIIIETPSGRIQINASLTHYIHPQGVSVPYGFGGLRNANYLSSWKITQPEVGMATYRGLPCRVMKALLGEPAKVVA